MGGEAAAARIVKRISGKGAEMADGQGGRLGTVLTVSPFKMTIDGISETFTSNEVVINPFLMGYEIEGKHQGEITITGEGSIGDVSGDVSITGSHNTDKVKYQFDVFIKDGDRVSVMPVGNNRWVVVCKVVNVP